MLFWTQPRYCTLENWTVCNEHLQQRRYHRALAREDRLNDWRVEELRRHCDGDQAGPLVVAEA